MPNANRQGGRRRAAVGLCPPRLRKPKTETAAVRASGARPAVQRRRVNSGE